MVSDWWRTRRARAAAAGAVITALIAGTACSDEGTSSDGPTVVVTFSVLGAVVSDLVGDAAEVSVVIPNGADPHEWQPSARDIERIDRATVIVANGLGLEEPLDDALDEAQADGVTVFEATDHVTLRTVGAGEPTDDHAVDDHADDDHADEAEGALDPHLWTDPLTLRDVVLALAPVLAENGIDVGDRATRIADDLSALAADVEARLAVIPSESRRLVTGHESLGYFADRFGFQVIGAVIPSFSTQAESSAGEIAALQEVIDDAGVPAIYTEMGTPASVVEAIADETGVAVVEVGTHVLPDDGTYRSFLLAIADAILSGLAPAG